LCLASFVATISNNLPATDVSIGADSAIGEIVYAVDKIKQSTVGHTRLYVIEVMGGKCGYLATIGGLVTGAELVYLNEVCQVFFCGSLFV
jgi:6-phosphofructokinase 1